MLRERMPLVFICAQIAYKYIIRISEIFLGEN